MLQGFWEPGPLLSAASCTRILPRVNEQGGQCLQSRGLWTGLSLVQHSELQPLHPERVLAIISSDARCLAEAPFICVVISRAVMLPANTSFRQQESLP